MVVRDSPVLATLLTRPTWPKFQAAIELTRGSSELRVQLEYPAALAHHCPAFPLHGMSTPMLLATQHVHPPDTPLAFHLAILQVSPRTGVRASAGTATKRLASTTTRQVARTIRASGRVRSPTRRR